MFYYLTLGRLRLYLAIPRAGPSFRPGLPKRNGENLGPSLARSSGMFFRPKHGPTVIKPAGPQASGQAPSLKRENVKPKPGLT